MERAQEVRRMARELVDEGSKPSATRIAQKLDFTQDDVHRCLNFLEREGEVETYTKEFLGRKHRMVGVNRL